MKVRRFYRALLPAGIALAALQPALAAARPDTEAEAPTIVIRGSSAPEAAAPGSGGSGIVLRGTLPPVPPPTPIYTCAPGYVPDPSLGCTAPAGAAYAPGDLDYWPYPWFDDAFTGGGRHQFRRNYARRSFLPRFAHHEFRRR